MPKNGLFNSGQGTPPIFANKSPVFNDPGSVFRRGQGGILPERGSRAQMDMVTQLLASGMQSSQNSGSPLLAALAPLIGGAVGSRTSGLFKEAQAERDASATDTLLAAMGGGTTSPRISTRSGAPQSGDTSSLSAAMDKAYPIGETGPAPKGNVDPTSGLNMGQLITETAQAIGANPLDLATAISYETAGTFDPRKKGPTTQWGQHEGLIQFGQPQQREYGVDLSSPEAAIRSQLGADGAIARYFKSNGFKPGMSGLDLYSTINAGAPGRYGASDANNGGAPGSVRDKWENQMAGHREKAARLLGGDFTAYANTGQAPRMGQDSMRELIGLMTNQDVSEPLRDLASTLLTQGMSQGGTNSPRQQIGIARDMLSLEEALNPQSTGPTYRAATPEEAEAYGATAGQIDTKSGRFYPASTGNRGNGEAAQQRQQNEATTIINKALETAMTTGGLSREEALAQIARDPIYGPQFQILGIDPKEVARQGAAEIIAQPPAPGFFERIFGGGSDDPSVPPAQPVPPQTNDPLGIR